MSSLTAGITRRRPGHSALCATCTTLVGCPAHARNAEGQRCPASHWGHETRTSSPPPGPTCPTHTNSCHQGAGSIPRTPHRGTLEVRADDPAHVGCSSVSLFSFFFFPVLMRRMTDAYAILMQMEPQLLDFQFTWLVSFTLTILSCSQELAMFSCLHCWDAEGPESAVGDG